ncbi:carbohydrate ABC transporter permease [Demequina sp. NBRC 110057]|uniref:carbohydrate ABC transporter permease n=1 Tax=Demequina sp. NBRC 110057 TaxID=1570346 RepID=UPI000A01273E|nr:sugar ABC transporter permease [Demequina sp. NBRC 110057]
MTPVALEKRPSRDKRKGGAKRELSPAARRRSLTGWAFLIPAAALIGLMMFWPMFQALLLSFQTGRGSALDWADPLTFNYSRMLEDDIFRLTLTNTLLYLVIQVPIMLISALVLANILNNPKLRWKGFWRTAIFVPAAISLVSYSLVFRTIFATDGLVNDALLGIGLIDGPINWLGETDTARLVIILGLLWRWTGFNVIFYLAALQNIDPTTLEAAKMDGAGPIRTFFSVTIPQMKPMILLTVIMSTNGTIQMFDESYNLTRGGPANTTMTMSHYLFDVSFQNNPNFGYGAALSYVILIIVAVLAAIQMKVGDKRD